MSKKTTKQIFKKTSRVLKTFQQAAEEFDVDDIQMYITTTEGTICEIHLSIDEEGVMHKIFNVHDSVDEMEESHNEMRVHQLYEEKEKPLLN